MAGKPDSILNINKYHVNLRKLIAYFGGSQKGGHLHSLSAASSAL